MRKHAMSLVGLIDNHLGNPTVGCEVGVWKGGTSVHLLRRFSSLHLLLVDRYSVPSEEEARIMGSFTGNRSLGDMDQGEINKAMLSLLSCTGEYQNRRTLMVGDSVESSTYVRDNLLDFVFVDAHHSYEATRFDIQTWFPKVKFGGLVCGHDYNGINDRKGLFGVKKAVDEFCKARGYKVEVEPGNVWWLIK